MDHYFTERPSIKSNQKKINYEIQGKQFEFITDNGVFSKNKVDYGTDVMLKAFLKNKVNDNIRLLDIGCGYGVVSVVLGTFIKNIKITLSDVNERALDLSAMNLENAQISEYKKIKSNVYNSFNGEDIFDVIMSNPPIRAGKELIFKIYEGAYDRLAMSGEFWCVIQTKHGAKSTQKKLEDLFNNCETVTIDSGYRIFRCIKNAGM